MSEQDRLNERLAQANSTAAKAITARAAQDVSYAEVCEPTPEEASSFDGKSCQWTSSDGIRFFPSFKSKDELLPGAYEISSHPSRGLYFQNVPIKTEGILRLPEKNVENVVTEIEKFWTLRDTFKKHKLVYKRGIFLWGPPGSGKTCAIQLCCRDLIEDHGGIVIRFSCAAYLMEGLRLLRQIEPVKPVIVIMEDMEELLQRDSESDVLQILDGGEHIDNIVFLATSNYPEMLGSRIINRPSRFDKRFEIGFPNKDSRTMYLDTLNSTLEEENRINVGQWVEDTDNFSMAHLKELFIAVCILQDDYDMALATLIGMTDRIQAPSGFREKEVGFGGGLAALTGAGVGGRIWEGAGRG